MIKLDDIQDFQGLSLFDWAITQQQKFSSAIHEDFCYCTPASLKAGLACWKCQKEFEEDMKRGMHE